MFIRATKTHASAGKPVHSFRLVESKRFGDKVRQIALLNLGTGFSVPRENWRELCDLIEMKLVGRDSMLETNPELEAAAKSFAGKLRDRRLEKRGPPTPRMAEVDLDSLDHEDSRSVGGERICLKALEDLRLRDILLDCGFSDRDARIACAVVVARMLHPASERDTGRWLRETGATAEILGIGSDDRALSRRTLYRISDRILSASESLQAALFKREHELLQIPETVVFYDLSNVHFHGAAGGELKRYGRSKQKRNDCPLATLALALDEAGFPRSAEVLPGNVSEPDTLRDAIARLAKVAPGDGPKPTVVMDAGIATESNLEWLGEQGCHWIAVSRGKKQPEPEGEPDIRLETKAGDAVKAWKLEAGEKEAKLRVAGEGRKKTEDSILARQRRRFEEGLTRLHEGLAVKGRMKRHDKIQQSIGRLKEKYSKVARQYSVGVETDKKGVNAVADTFQRNGRHAEADETSGSYILRTTRVGWDIGAVLQTYWKLSEIEATFRSLKSELGLRPVFHQLDGRIASHLLIAALAYHPVHLIRTRLKSQGVNLSWASIRNRMQGWHRITTTLRKADGALVVNRQDARPDTEQAMISVVAGAKPGLHRRRCELEG